MTKLGKFLVKLAARRIEEKARDVKPSEFLAEITFQTVKTVQERLVDDNWRLIDLDVLAQEFHEEFISALRERLKEKANA